MSLYVVSALILVVIAVVVILVKKNAAEAAAQAEIDALDEERNREMLEALARLQSEPERATEKVTQEPVTGRARLTDTQKVALHSALGYVIYADNQAQYMEHQREFYSPRTISSLVKRGFLEANGAGGYVITRAGEDELRISSGF